MLTDAQYKALKAWPDTSTATKHNDATRLLFLCGFLEPFGKDGFYEGLRKRQPACDAAIREYEATYNIKSNSKEI